MDFNPPHPPTHALLRGIDGVHAHHMTSLMFTRAQHLSWLENSCVPLSPTCLRYKPVRVRAYQEVTR